MGVYLKGGGEMPASEGGIAQAGVDHARVVVESSVAGPEAQRLLNRSDCLGVPAVLFLIVTSPTEIPLTLTSLPVPMFLSEKLALA